MRDILGIAAVALTVGTVACSDSNTGTTTGDIGVNIDAGDTGSGDAGDAGNEQACQTAADCDFELNECEIAACENNVCVIAAAEDFSECKDGFKCTGPDFCIGGQCGGNPINCDDEDDCTEDTCDAKTGCVNTPLTGAVCDDGDPCTSGDVCDAGQCTPGSAVEGCCVYDAECDDDDVCTDSNCLNNQCDVSFNFAPCDDGSPCTLQDHCDGAGACGGTGLVCDDGNPCTTDSCDESNGTCVSTQAPDGTACEDGNPCTTPDTCDNGSCVGQGSLCQCTADADCVPFEDGDLCNGTLKCLDFACVVDPITVVACNPTGDTACVKNTCDPTTGQCVPTPSADGTVCDDQNLCTDNDACTNGLCIGGNSSCDDNNPCTFDACSVATGCTHTNNTLPCDDGNACTGNDQCADGMCMGETLSCNDNNPCTDDSCDPATGCGYVNNTGACDDGNACTDIDLCADGTCVPGNNTCACVDDADCVGSEDGNLCNGTLHCVDNECVVDPTSVIACNTTGDTACTKTQCLPATGQCVPTAEPNGTACSDGTVCTANDACDTGICVGTTVSCDDGNICTTDSCNAVSGCQNVGNALPCDDGNSCTGNDNCATGNCVGTLIGCSDGNPCTVDSCDPALGCTATNAADGTACSDGNVCTTGDTCTAGMCGGNPLDCDDGNDCTADTCTNPAGCTNAPVANGTPCDDGSACSTNDNCQSGTCTGNPPSCDDGDPCTVDVCNPASGCEYSNAANGTACSDGDPCTAPDACQNGGCVPGGFICGCQNDGDCVSEEDGNVCNGTLFCDTDGNCKVDVTTIVTCPGTGDPCTTNVCQAATGACLPTAAGDGDSCDDGDDCTDNDICNGGVCAGLLASCDDGNPCTADSCVGGNCQYSPAFNGQPCADDGNECTLDICQGGTCSHPNVANGTACAGSATGCTTNQCQAGTCQATPVEDGFPCADDGNECTYDQCASGVCQHVSNDPAPVGPNECFPVGQITADSGVVSGSWSDCGVADQFDFASGSTGAINNWPCADPAFSYEGSNKGYEYAYVFVAPVNGTCTLWEYNEGYNPPGPGNDLFGVIDWFILSGGGCDASSCVGYMWENQKGGVCGGGTTCSTLDFPVNEGQVFYIVSDIYAGVGGDDGHPFDSGWDVEITCDSTEQLIIFEDFTDAVCNNCSASTSGSTCAHFDWHAIGGFQDLGPSYYLGDLNANLLQGYDCGATTSTLTFPSGSIPANATSCELSFDFYAAFDNADDGDCTNDILEVLLSQNGGPAQPVPGDSCAADTTSSNPIGSDTGNGGSQTMTYDVSYAIGDTVTLELAWSSDAANNVGTGIIIDNVKLSCTVP